MENVEIEETGKTDDLTEPVEKKKRGRRKKEITLDPNNIQIVIDEHTNVSETTSQSESEPLSQVAKKRGRKPKGGKLVLKQPEQNMYLNQIANIILHLKCSLSDLNEYNANLNKLVTNPMNYNPEIPPDILTYNDEEDGQAFYVYNNNIDKSVEMGKSVAPGTVTKDFINIASVSNASNTLNDHLQSVNYAYNESNMKLSLNQLHLCQSCNSTIKNENANNKINGYGHGDGGGDGDGDGDENVSIKDINYKLKKLKISLYKNAIQDKKSACFWCTYEFDNPPCYIPKYEMDSTVHGYGSFCRPECAVAYLMKENIDDSSKFERYHLLNQIYSKVYNFKKNIKPAPNPYYLLDKFYGNLSIQEYRKLLKTEHMLLVIDKPLTRILPELHEDNEDIVLNVYGGNKNSNGNTAGIYKVKRQSEKQVGPTKNSIMRNKFGLAP
jgi:hypothetical protein